MSNLRDIIQKLEVVIDSAEEVDKRVDERLHELNLNSWSTIQDYEIREMFDKHVKELKEIRQEIYEDVSEWY